jgi:hypothetical protein
MRITRWVHPGSVGKTGRELLLGALLAAPLAAQATWHVDASNPACPGSGTPADPFCTIAAAIDAAAPGDTIEVAPGTYPEIVVVAKDALILRGAGATLTTIVGQPLSNAVGPAGFGLVARFTLEGFRITSSDHGPGLVSGVWMEPVNAPGSLWVVRACIVEDLDVGIQANDAWGGAQALIEDTLVTRCGTGIDVFGDGVAVRRCTVFDIAGVGVLAGLPSSFEVSDSIIAATDAWAVQRYSGWPVTLQRVLIHDINLANPPAVPDAGPFMQYLAEGWPGGFGIWTAFTPSPGPILAVDPLFVDAAGGDVRLRAASPAVDAGAASAADPGQPYDLLGFGHPRVDDGDFDGLARADLGAVEFGGLLLNAGLAGELAAGQVFTATGAGPPGATFGLFVGLPGAPVDLGSKGTFFLGPAPLILLSVGTLPADGEAVVLAGTLPASAVGLDIAFQAARQSGGALHWTNAERLAVGP